MASEAQIAANRRNGALARGPVSVEGKAVAARNAVRHGIYARGPVVPGMESDAEWEEERAGVLAALRPEGRLEEVLAERVASVLWRLGRVTRAEREAIALRQEHVDQLRPEWPDRAKEEARRDRLRRGRMLPDEEDVGLLARYEAHLSRQLGQALHELQRRQAERGASRIAPPAVLDVTVNGAV